MITVRNPTTARALTVRAGEALEVGMIVKVAQGSAAGAPPTVVKCTAADLDDATVFKGIVDFVVDSDEAVDFDYDPTNQGLSLHTGQYAAHLIPANAQCVLWYDKPIIGFHTTAVDASLQAAFTTTREPAKVAFLVASSKLALYNAAAVDTGAENYMGFVYRNEGPELTVVLTAL